MSGPLALVGGAEWTEGCSFDAELLKASGGTEVLVVPTAAAYEHPDRAVATAGRYFAAMGASVRPLMVLSRTDAESEEHARTAREARFIYLGGGSPLHLRSVLRQSAVLAALLDAWREGAVLAGSSAGAMVLGDPMVDPRGGAFTVGLGVVPNVAVLPHAGEWSHERLRRTVHLAAKGVALLAIHERSAAIRDEAGWRAAGDVEVHVDGTLTSLEALPR